MVKLFRFVVATFVALFFMGVMLDFTRNDLIIAGVGVVTFSLVWYLMRKGRKAAMSEAKDLIDEGLEQVKTQTESGPRPYRFIFTHEEAALDSIESAVIAHPKVIGAFQDSGYWYSNGETGPEWFSMHVKCREQDSEEVKEFIREALKEREYSYKHINFMGSYN